MGKWTLILTAVRLVFEAAKRLKSKEAKAVFAAVKAYYKARKEGKLTYED